MEKLLALLNSLGTPERVAFCAACNTTENYIRRSVSAWRSTGAPLGPSLCINIERESGKLLPEPIRCEELRADVDWAFIRACDCKKAAA